MQTDKQMAGKWVDRTTRQRVKQSDAEKDRWQAYSRTDWWTETQMGRGQSDTSRSLRTQRQGPANILSVYLEKAKMRTWHGWTNISVLCSSLL